MAKSACLIFLLAVTIAVVAFAPPQAEAVISCNEVANVLTPCFNYVVYGGFPTQECCTGAKSLLSQAGATADRQAICSCLKNVASRATPSIISNAAGLPGKCGINIPYKIDPSTNCASIR